MAANLAEGPGSGSVRCSEGSLVVLVLLVVLHHVAMITWKKETDFDLLCADIFEQSPSSIAQWVREWYDLFAILSLSLVFVL